MVHQNRKLTQTQEEHAVPQRKALSQPGIEEATVLTTTPPCRPVANESKDQGLTHLNENKQTQNTVNL